MASPECLRDSFIPWKKFLVRLVLDIGKDSEREEFFIWGIEPTPLPLSTAWEARVAVVDSDHLIYSHEKSAVIVNIQSGKTVRTINGDKIAHEFAVFGNLIFIQFGPKRYRYNISTGEFELVELEPKLGAMVSVELNGEKRLVIIGYNGYNGKTVVYDPQTLAAVSRSEFKMKPGHFHDIVKEFTPGKILVVHYKSALVSILDLTTGAQKTIKTQGTPISSDVLGDRALLTFENGEGYVIINTSGEILDSSFKRQDKNGPDQIGMFLDHDHMLSFTPEGTAVVTNLTKRQKLCEVPFGKEGSLRSVLPIPLSPGEEREMLKIFTGVLMETSPLAKDTANVIAKFV